ncbi:hypothetical protein [Sorangium sp. So ce406]|uniref:hypothetical protein n=1 Tax=Sorangium sp. So ce406 TaxID=3133311 RepID=UPI003F5BC57C
MQHPPGSFQVAIGLGEGQATVAPPRSTVAILSWNLQNYTHDERQHFRRSMRTPRSEFTAAFVAETMRLLGADVLLVMETGSDVSAALNKVSRYFKQATQRELDPLVSELTHATPALRTAYTISKLTPTPDDVHALKNLVDAYRIEDITLAFDAGDAKKAWDLYCACRPGLGTPGGVQPPALNGDNTADAAALLAYARAVRKAVLQGHYSDPALRQVAAVMDRFVDALFTTNAATQAQSTFWQVFLEAVEPHRNVADAVPLFAGAEACFTALVIHHIAEGNLKRTDDLALALPRYHDSRLPALSCLLSMEYALEVSIDDPSTVVRMNDPSFVYRALEHFELISTGAETYGILCLFDETQRRRTVAGKNLQQILRLASDGTPLTTQAPGEVTNHRSAMRLVLPTRGPKDVEVCLFHTRFTPPKQITKQKTARTLKMRCDSIEAIAAVEQVKPGLPRVFFGDFNLPANDAREELRVFAFRMGSMGYTRYPTGAPFPLTTLKANSTILAGGAIYNEPYDAVYARDLSSAQVVDARVIAVLDVVDAEGFNPDIRAAMAGYAAAVYERLLTKLEAKLAQHEKEINEAANLNRGGTAARLPGRTAMLAELELCLRVFEARGLADDGAPGRPACAAFCVQARGAQEQARRDGAGRVFNALGQAEALVTTTVVALTNLETSRSVRIHAAYRYAVSDHIPVFLKLDLDQ